MQRIRTLALATMGLGLVIDWARAQEIVYPRNAYRIESGFYARRTITDWPRHAQHNGVDIVAPEGTKVYAGLAGTVVRIENGRRICGDWDIHIAAAAERGSGERLVFIYAHLREHNLRLGQRVMPTTFIGTVGDMRKKCENAEPPHLHFEFRRGNKAIPVDPVPWLTGRDRRIECVDPANAPPGETVEARRQAGRAAVLYPVECTRR